MKKMAVYLFACLMISQHSALKATEIFQISALGVYEVSSLTTGRIYETGKIKFTVRAPFNRSSIIIDNGEKNLSYNQEFLNVPTTLGKRNFNSSIIFNIFSEIVPQYNPPFKSFYVDFNIYDLKDVYSEFGPGQCAEIIYGGYPLECDKVNYFVTPDTSGPVFNRATNFDNQIKLPLIDSSFSLSDELEFPSVLRSTYQNSGSIVWSQFGGQIEDRSTSYPLGVRLDYSINDLFISRVPEPGSWLLLLMGYAIVGFSIRRRQAAISEALTQPINQKS